jgi:cysteinyl-tRNA synthetase
MEIAEGLAGQAEAARAEFESAMDDDFNTSAALSHLFELVRAINQARDAGAGEEALGTAQAALRELAGVLGLRLKLVREVKQEAGPFIDLLLLVRSELRQAKQWALADVIRDRLVDLGVTLEDGKAGTTWRAR